MSRALLVAALASLSLLALPLPSVAAEPPKASDLEAELVCPTCRQTLDQSDAPVARRMKQIIRERIAAGATADEIKQELVDQFGTGVLAEPPKRGFDLLAWVLPLALIGAGAVVVAALAWSWSRRRADDEPAPAEPIDPELERRIDDELARLDR